MQPHGVNDWRVAPMNVHDEVMCVTHPDYVEEVTEIVVEAVESYRAQVPLIGMEWAKKMDNWAEKGGGLGDEIHIAPPEEMYDDGRTSQLAVALDDATVEGAGFAEQDCELERIAEEEDDLNALIAGGFEV